jgi:2-iminobutanoate/2-iminopropanoate deaminase
VGGHGRRKVESTGAPAAIGPYSQAIETGDLVFLSGQIAMDPTTGEIAAGLSVGQEAERVMRNLLAVLEAAGATAADVVKTTIYLTDLGAFQAVNEVYGRFFEGDPPARATVQVSALPKGARVEIEAIARKAG